MAILRIGEQEIRIDGILFDKDGTLFDFMSLWGAWAQNLLAALKPALRFEAEPSPFRLLGTLHDEQGNVSGYDPKGPLAMASIPEIETIAAWHLYVNGKAWNDALELARGYCRSAELQAGQNAAVTPIAGLTGFLDQCSAYGVKTAVVTSDTTESAEKHLQWAGIRHQFHSIIGEDQVSVGKPHPQMVEIACSELGLHPSQTVLIGDSNGDMQMGKQAWVARVIGIAADGQAKQALYDADVLISSYEDLALRR